MKQLIGLYYIKDELSDLRISNFLEMPNDAVACKSFIKFLEDKKEDKHLYSLYRLTVVDANNLIAEDVKDKPNLICRGASAEDEFNVLMAKMFNSEEVE